MNNYGYNLDVDLFERFNLKVNDLYPLRNVYILNTDKGEKILKKGEWKISEFNFINSALEYISKSFDRVVRFERNIKGEYYTNFNGEIYVIMNNLEGTMCEFNNLLHLKIAAKGLSQLHNAGVGFKTKVRNRNNVSNLEISLKRYINELKFIHNLINKFDDFTEFDNRVSKEIVGYIEQAKRSLEGLKNTDYLDLCNEEDKITICHHDLAYHNILINEEKAYFVDFDYSIIDLRVHDLCNFINKVEKTFDFNIDKTKIILEEYCKESDLDSRELEVLYYMLMFPYDFYTICRDYYTRRKNWNEQLFNNKLDKKLALKDEKNQFLEEFKVAYNIR